MGLKLSIEKTQAVGLAIRHTLSAASVQLERDLIGFVDRYKYLGSILSCSASIQPELTMRVNKAGGAFTI